MAGLLSGLTAQKCPTGTKMHILNLGTLQGDDEWLLHGRMNVSTSPTRPRDLLILAALIEHPREGLILFDPGPSETYQPLPTADMFSRTAYIPLPDAIKATGNDIADIKAVVLSNLLVDHAGGLEHFFGTDVPIYVHEEEFQHACMAAATGTDDAYSAEYMDFSKLNFQTFADDRFHLCQGITLHHTSGPTPGSIVMQVNLANDGTFVWTGGMYQIAEQYELSYPLPWLVKDQNAWVRSHRVVQQLERLFQARMVFGRDKEVAEKLIAEKNFFQ